MWTPDAREKSMRVAIIGASGKTGTQLVQESLRRGYQVSAVCRDSSIGKLDEFAGSDGFSVTVMLLFCGSAGAGSGMGESVAVDLLVIV